jgi:hypothetical protein
MKIDIRVHEHIFRPLFQKNLETVQLECYITPLGGFGYVHSQRRASAARYEKYPHAVSGLSLRLNYFLELAYCIVGQTYHASSLRIFTRNYFLENRLPCE